MATRDKAKVNHSRVGDTLGLLASQGKERVSIVTSLNTLDGVALRGKDPRVMGNTLRPIGIYKLMTLLPQDY